MNVRIFFCTILIFVTTSCVTFDNSFEKKTLATPTDSWRNLDFNQTLKDQNTTFWVNSFKITQLSESVSFAWKKNEDLIYAAEQTIARGEEAIINGSNLLPQVNLGVNGSRSKRNLIGFNLPNGNTSFTSDSFDSGLNLSWEIDLWGKIKDQQKSGNKKFQMAHYEYEAMKQSLAANVVKNWFSIVENKKQFELSKKTSTTFKKNHELLANRFANGLASLLDKDLALNAFTSAQANQVMRQRLLNGSIRKFELLLGKPVNSLSDGNFSYNLPDLKLIPIPPTPSQTLENRPDLKAAHKKLEALGYDLKVAQKSLLPSISISGNTGSRTDEFSNLLEKNFRTWEFSGSIMQPIFNNGRIKANIRRSKALESAAIANYRSTALKAFSEVETFFANENFLNNEVSFLNKASEAANSAANASWNRYQNGVLGIFDTLESQRRAYEAESRLLSMRKERIINRIRLYLALGSPALSN